MANWRQVQARIRKAKNAPDAAQKLTELFEKTRDGMVAFELATLQEKQGNTAEAVRWLTSAAEHFRRSDWKNKVAEALTRLGAPVPASLLTGDSSGAAAKPAAEKSETPHRTSDDAVSAAVLAAGEIVEGAEEEDEEESADPPSAAASSAGTAPADVAAASGKRRRRGRRGGRGRRKKGPAAQAPGLPSQSFARSTPSPAARIEPAPVMAIPSPALDRRAASSDRIEHTSARAPWVRPEPEVAPLMPSERAAGRAGEPALASRLAYLENTLRRLVRARYTSSKRPTRHRPGRESSWCRIPTWLLPIILKPARPCGSDSGIYCAVVADHVLIPMVLCAQDWPSISGLANQRSGTT